MIACQCISPCSIPLLLKFLLRGIEHQLSLKDKVLSLDSAIFHEPRQRIDKLALGRAVKPGSFKVVETNLEAGLDDGAEVLLGGGLDDFGFVRFEERDVIWNPPVTTIECSAK